MKKLLPLAAIIFLLSCDKEDGVINQPPPPDPTCRISLWIDTMFTGVLRHNVFEYNEHGNPVSVHSEHDGTGSEPDSFYYDDRQRLIKHVELFTFVYSYEGNDTLPKNVLQISPYNDTTTLVYSYDDKGRVAQVNTTVYTYDDNGNLINDDIVSSDYTDKPSLYSTNKWWQLIHLNFSKNALNVGSDYNECGLPASVNKNMFLSLGAGQIEYEKSL